MSTVEQLQRISRDASQSIFRMDHAALAALLVPKGNAGWLLVNLTVGELRAAFRRKAVREDARVRAGLQAWGTADSPIRLRLDFDTERVLDELRVFADPITDHVVQALIHLSANPAPSYSEVTAVIDCTLELRDIGARCGERGLAAARLADWNGVTVGEFREGLVAAEALIEHFTVDGEPMTELLEAGLPDWARPLIEEA